MNLLEPGGSSIVQIFSIYVIMRCSDNFLLHETDLHIKNTLRDMSILVVLCLCQILQSSSYLVI